MFFVFDLITNVVAGCLFLWPFMGHKKLIRFEAINNFKNVLQYPENMAGNWKDYFGNNNPIVLELACGKGEYTIGQARMFKDKNFIGIDIKGNRIWRGATIALEENLSNVAFLRTEIDKIANYFANNEIVEIWITFPDPQLRISKAKKRLTHPKFLRLYQQFLQKGGSINLKTDSPNLHHFTKGVIDVHHINCEAETEDVYNSKFNSDVLNIKTYYETLNIAKSNSIHYLKFTIDNELFIEKDVLLKQIIEIVTENYPR